MNIRTMKEAREACAQRGITPARSLAETLSRIKAHDEKMAEKAGSEESAVTRAEARAMAAYQDEMRRADALGEKRHMDEVIGLAPRTLLVRARPRQAFGIVGDIMTPFANVARYSGARPSDTYRAARRNAAKVLRRSIRKAGNTLVPARV